VCDLETSRMGAPYIYIYIYIYDISSLRVKQQTLESQNTTILYYTIYIYIANEGNT